MPLAARPASTTSRSQRALSAFRSVLRRWPNAAWTTAE
jgi:hypothetical protein